MTGSTPGLIHLQRQRTEAGSTVKRGTATKRLGIPVLPAVLAVGAFNPALALELGDINVRSTLGQPLRASLAFALAPNEQLPASCVSVVPVDGNGGVPAVSAARISIAANSIEIAGTTAVREPVISARIRIRCPYAPAITRDYVMLVDPSALVFESRPTVATSVVRESSGNVVIVPSAPPPRAEAAAVVTPLSPGSSYRVQPGDTLLAIARRLDDPRSDAARTANAIFVANPQAFVGGDPDRLMAGSMLSIPEQSLLVAATPLRSPARAAASEPVPAAAPASQVAPAEDLALPAADDTAYLAPATVEPESIVGEAPAIRVVGGMQIQSAIDAPDEFAGDLSNNQEAVAADAGSWQADVAADVAAMPAPPRQSLPLPAEPATAEADVQAADPPVVAASPEETRGGTLWWVLGGALALIGGLLFWRRRVAGRQETTIDAIPVPPPIPEDAFPLADDSIEVQVINSLDADAGLDFDLSDDAPTEENPQLAAGPYAEDETADADIPAAEIEQPAVDASASPSPAVAAAAPDVAAATDVDVADEEEPVAHDSSATDIIPPLSREIESILEEEVMPGEHDYDISVIMDITKARPPEEATEKDLKAVFVDFTETTINQDGYSLNQEMDYQILEQDYEDDLTATQAVNLEIEKATRDMMASLDDDLSFESEILSQEDVTDLQFTGITGITDVADIAENDDFSDLDDTSVNELTANMKVGDHSPGTGSSSG